MGSGKYNKKMAIQVVTEADDDYLSKTDSWATDRYIWCRIKPLRGYEKVQAAAIDSSISHKIESRYDSALSVKNRLKLDSRIFKIRSVINIDEANKGLEILAVEDT